MARRHRPPALILYLELEQLGRFHLSADTYEDEQRLRLWLRRSYSYRQLPDLLARLVEGVDELDHWRDREAA